ncbi:MAG TPA: zf-HC2 domain-containing protein [Kofleriaceae bacterium]|jgi:anti-sigma factor RsiW
MTSCNQLDAFYDGELSAEEAAAFREHLATCARCQAALRGRMAEEVVVDEARGAPVASLSAARNSRRRIAVAAAMVAFAAAAALALVMWKRPGPAPSPRAPEVALELSLARGSEVMRGHAAHVGDVVHVAARTELPHHAVWVYRGDHELVASSSAPADVPLRALGTYSVVALASSADIPAPHGSLDADVAGAAAAGAIYRIDTVDVQ